MQDGVETILKAGPLSLDLERREVRENGQVLSLSRREFALLEILMRNLGKVITHRQLLTAVWGPAHVEDLQYLRVYIWHLRQKLSAETIALLINEPAARGKVARAEAGLKVPHAGSSTAGRRRTSRWTACAVAPNHLDSLSPRVNGSAAIVTVW
jgi:hypothetical protein